MSRVILLDTRPLGLLTNPKKTPEPRAITRWALNIMAAGHRLIVPAIADYEVRHELERVGQIIAYILFLEWCIDELQQWDD